MDKLREKLNNILLQHLDVEKSNLEKIYSNEEKFTKSLEKKLNENSDEILEDCNKMDVLTTERMHSEQQFLSGIIKTVETFVHGITSVQQKGLSDGTMAVQGLQSLVELSEKGDEKRANSVEQFVINQLN